MTPETSNNADGGLRQFTARKFEGTDGDYKEYKAEKGGHPVTETTWVHHPSIEDGGHRTGQTYPFYFDSENPARDGLRARLPDGDVIAATPMLAQQRRDLQQASSSSASNSNMGLDGARSSELAAVPDAARGLGRGRGGDEREGRALLEGRQRGGNNNSRNDATVQPKSVMAGTWIDGAADEAPPPVPRHRLL